MTNLQKENKKEWWYLQMANLQNEIEVVVFADDVRAQGKQEGLIKLIRLNWVGPEP